MKDTTALKVLNDVEIGRRLRTQRDSLHLTREQVAEKMDITPKFISDIERGEKSMALGTLYKFMQLYNMSADFILTGNEESNGETLASVKQIRENILGSLSTLNEHQLSCMEQMVFYFKSGLGGNADDKKELLR